MNALPFTEVIADAVAVALHDALEQLNADSRTRLLAEFLALLERHGVRPPQI